MIEKYIKLNSGLVKLKQQDYISVQMNTDNDFHMTESNLSERGTFIDAFPTNYGNDLLILYKDDFNNLKRVIVTFANYNISISSPYIIYNFS
jgi:hypothetical protein